MGIATHNNILLSSRHSRLAYATCLYHVDLIRSSTSSIRFTFHQRIRVTYTRFARQAFWHSSATIGNSLRSEITSLFDSLDSNVTSSFTCSTNIPTRHAQPSANGCDSTRLTLLGRIARTTYIDAVYCYRPSSVVGLSVCRSVTLVIHTKRLNQSRCRLG